MNKHNVLISLLFVIACGSAIDDFNDSTRGIGNPSCPDCWVCGVIDDDELQVIGDPLDFSPAPEAALVRMAKNATVCERWIDVGDITFLPSQSGWSTWAQACVMSSADVVELELFPSSGPSKKWPCMYEPE
jgi:hypothetical protein